MTRNSRFGRPALLAGVLALAASLTSFPRAQSVTGVVPNWADLEAWTRIVSSTREVEHGLGLQLSGPGGTMMLSFAGRVDQRTMAPPADVLIVVAPPIMANPNIIRTASLRFLVDDGTTDKAVIDATPSLRVDDPSPGAVIRSAAGRLSAASFARLTRAKTIRANVFGSDSPVRPDQIKAMSTLAGKLKVK